MILAVVLAGGITYFAYRRMRTNVAPPKMIQIVAANKDVPAGVAMATEDVGLIQWPEAAPLAGSFSKVEDVVGRPLIYPLGKGEPVMARDLAVPGSGIGLSVKIPPGMRATSVRSNEVVGVAGFLYPGSHVDVLATLSPPGGTAPVTETLLQNVEVLTAGEKIEPDPTGKPQTVNVVTFLLSPEDSEKLLMASTQSTLQFVMRNGADQGQEKVSPIIMTQLLTSQRPPALPPPATGTPRHTKGARPAVQAPLPQVFVVEVIQGQTRKEEKFSGTPKEGSEKNQ